MKKVIIGILMMSSISVFSYDGRFLAKNCVGANISKDQLSMVKTELSRIGIKYKVIESPTPYAEYRVIGMGRNGMIKISFNYGIYFKMNRRLQKILDSKALIDEGIDFSLTSIGECLAFKKY